MQSSLPIRTATAVALAAIIGGAQAAFAAGAVSVTVNGNALNLNPAPTERAGRVFVPLRGVFENLGASVVYEAGTINATGRGHNVSLKIGSNVATVDGAQQRMDVAPFIIGASTYVPLRFVSQALGATVNYDGANRIVAISASGNAAPPPQQPPNETVTPVPTPARTSALRLVTTVPARGSHITSRQPSIEATFDLAVDPNRLHVTLDDLDVSGDASRNPHGFAYSPRSPLQTGQHVVKVSGVDANGASFARGWDFWSP